MFGLKRLLGGKANELKVVSKKIENRNLMEAIVGASCSLPTPKTAIWTMASGPRSKASCAPTRI